MLTKHTLRVMYKLLDEAIKEEDTKDHSHEIREATYAFMSRMEEICSKRRQLIEAELDAMNQLEEVILGRGMEVVN